MAKNRKAQQARILDWAARVVDVGEVLHANDIAKRMTVGIKTKVGHPYKHYPAGITVALILARSDDWRQPCRYAWERIA